MDKIKTLKDFESLEYTKEAIFKRYRVSPWYQELRDLGFDEDLKAVIEVPNKDFSSKISVRVEIDVHQIILSNKICGSIYTNTYSHYFSDVNFDDMLRRIDAALYQIHTNFYFG